MCPNGPYVLAMLDATMVIALPQNYKWSLHIGGQLVGRPWQPVGSSCSDQTPAHRAEALVIAKGHLVNNIIYIVGVVVIIIAIASYFGLR